MKKLLTTLFIACIAVVANAQSFIGGTLGIGVTNQKMDGNSNTSAAIMIAPEAGYKLNTTWALGVTLGYQYQDLGHYNLNTLKILPYVRGTYARVGNVGFFGELAAGYGHLSTDGDGVSGFMAGLRPGMAVNFNEKFGLILRTTLLEYSYFDELHTTGFSINGNLELGVEFTF